MKEIEKFQKYKNSKKGTDWVSQISYIRYIKNVIKLDQLQRPQETEMSKIWIKNIKKILNTSKIKNYIFFLNETLQISYTRARSITETPKRVKAKMSIKKM